MRAGVHEGRGKEGQVREPHGHAYRTDHCTDQKEIMVLRLGAEVLEDRLFPVAFHVIPVVDLTMTNRVVDTVSWRLSIGERFVTDEEVEVLDPALRGEIARLCWYCRSRSTRLGGRSTSRDGSWENAVKKIALAKGGRVGSTSWDACSQRRV